MSETDKDLLPFGFDENTEIKPEPWIIELEKDDVSIFFKDKKSNDADFLFTISDTMRERIIELQDIIEERRFQDYISYYDIHSISQEELIEEIERDIKKSYDMTIVADHLTDKL